MGYSNTLQVDLILGQALTSARPDTTTQKIDLINIGEVRNLNRIPNTIVEFYISQADARIDGILSQQYYTPFPKCATWQSYADEDINVSQVSDSGSGDSSGLSDSSLISTEPNIIIVQDACNLVAGDEIMIHNDSTGLEEDAIVQLLVDRFTIQTLEDIEGVYMADDGIRIIRRAYPPTVTEISARLAAAFIYDKYFSAQNSPNVSDYGNKMRDEAEGRLNDILNGRIIIDCNCHRGGCRKGDLFGNPYLDDNYSLRDRGFNTSERNISRPGG